MLKWLVTGRDVSNPRGEEVLTTSAGVTEDPLAAIGGDNTDKIYNVHRTNPLFSDDEPDQEHQASQKINSKACQRTSSYSSGYWSNKGLTSDNTGLLHMTSLLETNTELESCDKIGRDRHFTVVPVPTPVWPGWGESEERRGWGERSSNRWERGERFEDKRTKLRKNAHELEGVDKKQGKREGVKKSSNLEQTKENRELEFDRQHRNSSRNGEYVETTSYKQTSEDRCFGIRHQPIADNKKELDDTIVTKSVLQMTGFSTTEEESEVEENNDENLINKSREDMDKVIRELATAVMKSKGVSVLTKAVAKSKSSDVDYYDIKHEIPEDNNINVKRKRRRSIEERNARILNRKAVHKDNLGYLSDGSDISIPKKDTARDIITNNHKINRHSSTASSSSLQLSAARLLPARLHINKYRQSQSHLPRKAPSAGPDPSSWFLARKEPRPLRTDLDFKNYQYNYGLFRAEEMFRVNVLEHHPKTEDMKQYQTKAGSEYVLNRWNGGLVIRKKKKRKFLVSCLKSVCFLLLLASFIVVIITVSAFLTRDNKKVDTT